MNPSFWLVETFCLVETVCFNSELFLCYWISLLKLEGTNLKEKHFLLVETVLFYFLARRNTVFRYSVKVFFNECFIADSANGFSGQYKPFLHIFLRLLPVKAYFSFSGNVFLNESSISAIRELFFQVETNFMASGNHFMPLSQIFFKEPFIPVNRNAFFSPKENVFLFIKNFLSCQWKLLLSLFETLITTILFYFSNISVSGNRFSIQQKQYSFIYRFFPRFLQNNLIAASGS